MIKPEYATYRYTKKAGDATAQSKVECRVSGSEISEVLAVRAEAYPSRCSCADKQVDYGGKALFTIVYIDGEEMKTQIEPFFQMLFAANPASVGGALPAEDFYYSK